MAFQYQGHEAYGQPAPLEYGYSPEQQQGQGQDGMSPMQMMNMGNKMGLFGGEGVGGNSLIGGMEGSAPWQNMFGGGGMQGGGALGSQGGGAMVGNAGGGMGAGAAGGGGWQGAAAAAGPWAALAAAVIGTEIGGKEAGRRGDDTGDWINHAFGKGLSRDTEYYTGKIFGEDMRNDKLGLGSDMNAVTNLMSGDFSNAWDDFKDGSLGKAFGWIGDIF